ARSSPPRALRGAGPPRPRRGRRPRLHRPRAGHRLRRLAQLADQHPADRRRHLRDPAEDAGAAADRHGRHRQHRQPQAGLQRRPPGRPDAALVRHHRADRRRHRHRPRAADRARPQQLRRRRRPGGPRERRVLVRLPDRHRARQRVRPAGLARRQPVVQRPAADRRLRRRRHRRAQGRRGRRAVRRLRPLGPGDRPEGPVVGHPARAAGHGRPHRQCRRQLRLGVAELARRLRRRCLRRPRARAVRRLPGAPAPARPLAAAVLRGRVAGHPARLRLPLLDRHPAGDRARDRAEPRRPAVLRLLRRPAGGDDQDGRLRGDLPGAGGDLRGPVLRRGPGDHRLPAHRVGLGDRLGRHRRRHRRGRHADPDAVDPGPAAGRRRAAAGDRPDPRHGPHRGERRGSGPGADDRGQARGHPRPRSVPVHLHHRPARPGRGEGWRRRRPGSPGARDGL
ncbi:MAG: Proton/glutamate symporter @ Sodium/glutamate symporter, partial [uncultured Blastococcus sp.]